MNSPNKSCTPLSFYYMIVLAFTPSPTFMLFLTHCPPVSCSSNSQGVGRCNVESLLHLCPRSLIKLSPSWELHHAILYRITSPTQPVDLSPLLCFFSAHALSLVIMSAFPPLECKLHFAHWCIPRVQNSNPGK